MKKTVFQKTKYYAKDSHSTIRFWEIEGFVEVKDDRKIGRIEWTHGALHGETIGHYEVVPDGLAGRSIEEQVLLRVESRIHNKMKSGYTTSIDDARENLRTNLLGLKQCMTAKKYKDSCDEIVWKYGVKIQRKYNGFRCMINNTDGDLTPYTRGGLIIPSVGHITSRLEIPDGITLDGELYYHGVPFQTVSSWIKKKQPESKNLQYIIYDVMLDDVYSKRLDYLRNLDIWNDNIVLAETFEVYTEEDARLFFRQFREEGYEGAMLRIDGHIKSGKGMESYKKVACYEDRKRSKSLIKMKEWMDEEFLIVGITASAEDLAICECITKDGKKFTVTAPGNHGDKQMILRNKDQYIGQYLQVEFAEYTVYGKPFHPVAVKVRNKALE